MVGNDWMDGFHTAAMRICQTGLYGNWMEKAVSAVVLFQGGGEGEGG